LLPEHVEEHDKTNKDQVQQAYAASESIDAGQETTGAGWSRWILGLCQEVEAMQPFDILGAQDIAIRIHICSKN
jgi:hypothetical protein